MSTIWRIQTRTSKGDIAQYCLDNNIAAVGWSLTEYPNRDELNHLEFNDYCEYADRFYKSYSSVVRLAREVRENDIIWMRMGGVYYLARVKDTSGWLFNNDSVAVEKDACNQLSNIEWERIGDESEIPGALTTAFIRGATLQRIYKPGICEYSELIYNQMHTSGFNYDRSIELTEKNFYSLISPTDCEDLLYMWLYSINNKNYVCIPSTNKIATEKYEFVLLDSQTGKHIYIQVKNGDVLLNADDYYPIVQNTDNEFYLLSTRGRVINAEKYPNNIFAVDPTTLFDFACNEQNQNIIPPNIKYWIEFAGGYSSISGRKGIIFDTDNENSEQYMFDRSVVAAWGKPKRYINSFSNGDYVFYYKKWYGIIAVGKIVSEQPKGIESGLEHTVEMIIGRTFDNTGKIISIYPSEIKKTLKKQFYFASTRKVPFLDAQESQTIIDLLKHKIEKQGDF